MLDNRYMLRLCTTLIEYTDLTTILLRQQNYDRGLRSYRECITTIEKLLQCINQIDEQPTTQETLMEMLPSILKTQEWKDYVLLADLLELQLRPYVVGLVNIIMNKVEYIPIDLWEENVRVISEADQNLSNIILSNTQNVSGAIGVQKVALVLQ